MTLILVCGQGGIGKTTYSKKLFYSLNNINKTKIISKAEGEINTIFDSSFYSFYKQAIENINNEINNYEYFICDLPLESPEDRQRFLSHINFLKTANLIVIQLRPPFMDFIENMQFSNEDIDLIKNIYNNFIPAHPMEFEFLPFKKVSLYIIDNYNKIIIKGDKEAEQYLV